MITELNDGDDVAVLPAPNDLRGRVEIATVRFAGSIFVHLDDGRTYLRETGLGVTPTTKGRIAAVVQRHRPCE